MTDQIQEIVTRLPDMESVTGVWDTAEDRLGQGDFTFVADLGVALVTQYGSSGARIWQYRSVFDRLLRLLALTPGQEHAESAARVVAAAPDNGKLARYAASLLADGQDPKALKSAFAARSSSADDALDELRCCLVQELVLRGVSIAENPEVEAWATSPYRRRHPLAWLPLELSAIEEAPSLPSYSVGGSSYCMPYGAEDDTGVTLGSAADLPSVTDTTTDAFRESAAAAVANWAEESNGCNEAGSYDLSGPIHVEALPDLLVTLGLECLSGTYSLERPTLAVCRPEDAWEVLFAAASTGGAYNNGEYGAYGRLASWRSLAALSGASTTAPVGEVEERARECGWYSFGAASKWFRGVAWDMGLVSVSQAGRRIAVLAATDTD
ncbi:DUF6183 family protein [Streptomyces sp. NPDC101209]|uniref:DUF6183 family protein n=1 Tax=Streptomyces sp. NPDC101209 TaxID=3366129 RepID=UPI003815A990